MSSVRNRRTGRIGRVPAPLAALCLGLLLAGCAAGRIPPVPEEPPMHTISEFRDQSFGNVDDPWEGFNRSMYTFNYYLDQYLFLPVVNLYEFITPTFLQKGVSNLFSNLREVRYLTNHLLQGKPADSGTTLGRFLTNSTLGLGGLLDVATPLGLGLRPNDFGRTLGTWGLESGPYLVLPVFGPSTLRDAGGLAVDSGIRYGIYAAIDPFAPVGNELELATGVSALEAIDTRHRETFRYHRSDYPFEYYMVRFFYYQKRDLDIRKDRGEAPAEPEGAEGDDQQPGG